MWPEDFPLERLPLKRKTFNDLKRAGFEAVGDVLRAEVDDLDLVWYFGRGGFCELCEVLASAGEGGEKEWTTPLRESATSEPIAVISLPGLFCDRLESASAADGANDPKFKALRLACKQGRRFPNGRGHKVRISVNEEVLRLLLEYSELRLSASRGTQNSHEAKMARKVIERVSFAYEQLFGSPLEEAKMIKLNEDGPR
jgi:hypothetical protein